ncbi:hypothetical protein [Variovorax sp. EBFNA2]|uniref:hypothetical protein n=1 Tax=Variovorax sp. EBFNA2 TaxID=3342097 RepID=UPI0029C0D05A|nr:hypothetical protein [Variovorax boronicumulans]WPG35726.1 hypothetical protein RZE79_19780 [Variovorax boronicumulans]
MSALHMFLPVSEPARSEALAQFIKTHHIPRHLVRGISHKTPDECGPPAPVRTPQELPQASGLPATASAQG